MMDPRLFPRYTTPRAVLRAIATEWEIDTRQITSARQDANTAQWRAIAMAVVRETTDASLTEIGRLFSRHHTTVLHAVARVAKRRGDSADYDAAFRELCARVTT